MAKAPEAQPRNFHIPHARVTKKFTKPSRTKQEFKEDCDINVIINRFTRTGVIPVGNAAPRYLDCRAIPDFQTMQHIMHEAQAAFMRLPANVRKEFDHDPRAFVEFAQNPDNIDKLREWKLAPAKPEEPAPQRVEIVNRDHDPLVVNGPTDTQPEKKEKTK